MNKIVKKYIRLYVLGISFISFLFFLITHLIITVLTLAPLSIFAVFFIASIILAAMVVIIYSVIDPIILESVSVSRRLYRFESLSNPLLLKLSSEAPGTYHHSMNVSNLAQKAAKSIGADSLLVRTAAYYHDVGKLSNPTFFVENQSRREIPAEPSPESIKKSAEFIISHASLGVEIAKKYNLPEEIVDIVAQHHGTTRAEYFYEKAKENGLKVKQTDFRYKGPKPLTKEAAIIMLADTVEAAARAQPNLTQEKIATIVENAIKDKSNDGQFKNTPLTENELTKIKQSLESSLNSIYHQRIEYKKNDLS